MILPMNITYLNLKKDIPINIVITVLLLVLGMNFSIFGCGANRLSRVDGLVLLALFCLYMYMSFHFDTPNNNEEEPGETKKTGWAILLIVLGLNGLVVGGKLFVDSAVSIAKMLNVSDKFIAVTILAGGTSMPELATCLVAAVKKKGQLALGNIIGSNVFNILLILGGSALIHPLSLEQIGFVDLGILLLSSLVILTSAYIGKKNKIDRIDGIFFVLLEIAYMTWLIMEK